MASEQRIPESDSACSAKSSVIAKTALGPLIMGACHLQSPVRLSVHATEAAITDSGLPLHTAREEEQVCVCVWQVTEKLELKAA